jgi:hypothetical protein
MATPFFSAQAIERERDCDSRLRSATEDFKRGRRRVLIVEACTDIIGTIAAVGRCAKPALRPTYTPS